MKAITVFYHSLLGSVILLIAIAKVIIGDLPRPTVERESNQKIRKPAFE